MSRELNAHGRKAADAVKRGGEATANGIRRETRASTINDETPAIFQYGSWALKYLGNSKIKFDVPRSYFNYGGVMKNAKAICLVMLLASVWESAASNTCYVVYDRDQRVVYSSDITPVKLSRPIHETLFEKYPGGHLEVIRK